MIDFKLFQQTLISTTTGWAKTNLDKLNDFAKRLEASTPGTVAETSEYEATAALLVAHATALQDLMNAADNVAMLLRAKRMEAMENKDNN
ncbi:MAG TPA: hypothetical protein VH475_08240 [Tepidisphaeraceae bacterium]|jgi:hypothetical protein